MIRNSINRYFIIIITSAAASSTVDQILFSVAYANGMITRCVEDRTSPFIVGRCGINNDVSLDFVFLPGGTYQIGCSEGDTLCQDNETPSRRVTVSPFWIGKYEVTQLQWLAVTASNPSKFVDCGLDCPVEQVSWFDVQDFLQKLGPAFRLPTEVEWEFAARAGSANSLYGRVDDVAWYRENSLGVTHSVGKKFPNSFGLSDMLGNVWEWCQDAPERLEMNDDFFSSERILRGGAWIYEEKYIRSSTRIAANSRFRGAGVGFRVVLSKKELSDF